MAAPSFKHVTEEGFRGYIPELSQGGWALIDITGYAGPKGISPLSLMEATLQQGWKLRVAWVLAEVVAADSSADSAQAADEGWDGSQRKGSGLLYAASHDPDPAKRAAAGRLLKTLMKGGGSRQTKMGYHQEVDYGRNQLVLAKEPQNAADIALLGLADWLAEVEQATEMLAAAIGHDQGTGLKPYQRKRAALAACAANFAAVESEIAWVLRHGPSADHERAHALLESLHGLANRYPPPSPGPKPTEPPEPAPTT